MKLNTSNSYFMTRSRIPRSQIILFHQLHNPLHIMINGHAVCYSVATFIHDMGDLFLTQILLGDVRYVNSQVEFVFDALERCGVLSNCIVSIEIL